MPDIPVYNMNGEKIEDLKVSDDIFNTEISKAVVHQALVRQQANMRRGTHSTKTRGEVRGGGRKPWRQKGTGRSRHGSIRSPLWRGGGITFGPRPRDYSKKMPKKMRKLAICSVLTDKVSQEKMIAMDEIKFETPKTKDFIAMMKKLGMEENALFVIGDKNFGVEESASNLPDVKVITLDIINVYDILKYDRLVMTKDAISRVEEVLA